MNRALTIAVGAVLALVLVAVVAVFVFDVTGQNTVAEDVRVATVDVGAMERDEAAALIRRRLAGTKGEKVAVMFRDRHVVLRPEVVRSRVDVDATVDAALDADAGETVTPRLTFARAGVAVNRPALVQRLAQVLRESGSERRVDVPVRVTERPDRTFEDLAKRYPAVIAVDRDAKQLRLYKNLKLEKKYKIAVGAGGTETAAGRYKIVEKTVDPPWHAPNKEWAGDLAGKTIPPGDPQNPLEARWMGFHDGQGIHGTADIASLGSAASHGCIRMSVPAVKRLFREVKVGTPLFLQ